MKAEPRSKQNGGGGGKGRKAVRTPHPFPESLTLRTTPKKPASYAGYPENFSDELNMSGNEHRDVPFKFRALPPTPPQIPPPPPPRLLWMSRFLPLHHF